jgi:hypothetical protein
VSEGGIVKWKRADGHVWFFSIIPLELFSGLSGFSCYWSVLSFFRIETMDMLMSGAGDEMSSFWLDGHECNDFTILSLDMETKRLCFFLLYTGSF